MSDIAPITVHVIDYSTTNSMDNVNKAEANSLPCYSWQLQVCAVISSKHHLHSLTFLDNISYEVASSTPMN